MEINQHTEGAILVLEPVGRLDNKSSQVLLEKVLTLLNDGQRRLVLDLVQTEHIGGAGLRVLLMLTKKLDSMNGGLILCSMSDQVKKAFDVAGFTRRFTIVSSRPEAVKSLSGDETVARVSDLAAQLLARSEETN